VATGGQSLSAQDDGGESALDFDPENGLDFDVEMNFEALEDHTANEPEAFVSALASQAPQDTNELDEDPVLDESPIAVMDDPPAAPPLVALTASSKPLIDPNKTLEYTPEFDDALLKPRQTPRDAAALTVIEDQMPTRGNKRAKTQAQNGDRRVSRAAQAPGVKKIYDRGKTKTTQSPPLWAWVLAALMLVGTGIFAAPALLRQFAAPGGAKPQTQNNFAVPTLPNAPVTKPQPAPTQIATKPQTAKPTQKPAIKPVAKPAAKPVAKPATKPVPKPAVKPTPKPATKPQQATTPAPKPVPTPAATPPATTPQPTVTQQVAKPAVTPKPAAKPTPKPVVKPQAAPPKPRVDAQSAANLPPITDVQAAPKPTPKPAAKPAPKPAPKPAAKPAPKPTPQPVATTTPEPAATPVAPAAPTIDPNNLTREQIGRRFLNEKYFEDWLSRGAKLRYPTWAEVPIALQVASLPDFRTAVLIALP
jgi:hypothetical protein